MANSQPGLIGRKIGMTQLFDDTGQVVPVTVVQAGPNHVVQVKRAEEKDGYDAVQLGFDEQKPQRVNKPESGHFLHAEVPPTRLLREIRLMAADLEKYPQGETVGPKDIFEDGERVDVTGISKGRGFAGVVKRYHFAGSESTHGTHEYFRHGGAIGTRLTPGHVLKGQRMPGHMGAERVTVQNLLLFRVDGERHLLFIRGGIPGANGAWVTVRKAVRTAR